MRMLPTSHEEAHKFWAVRIESVCLTCTDTKCEGVALPCTYSEYVSCQNSRELQAVCSVCEQKVPDNPPTFQGIKGTLPELTCAAVMIINKESRQRILDECDLSDSSVATLTRKIGALYVLATDQVLFITDIRVIH